MQLTIEDKARLNNGIEMPYFGLGTYKIENPDEAVSSVITSLLNGYRLIDTARMYNNEIFIGEAIASSGVPREDIFITSKLWINEHGRDKTLFAVEDSLKNLKTNYIDLYLIHWPSGGKRIETWKTLESLISEGKCKAIGVSNFAVKHINELLDNCDIVPAVNQVEFSPFLYQKNLLDFCRRKGIQLEAYSPLGRGYKVDDPKIEKISKKYSKSTPQVLIRWALQHKVIVIPKSSNEKRIKENTDIFDFDISNEDMKYLDSLNSNYRLADNPEDMD